MSDEAVNAAAGVALPNPLRDPWTDLARQREAATLGMWLFLMSEMLFFGAVFMAFSFSRALDVAAFQAAARETEIAYGAANTRDARHQQPHDDARGARGEDRGPGSRGAGCLRRPRCLGVIFLVIKGFEYRDDLEHHLYPALDFALGRERGADLLGVLLDHDRPPRDPPRHRRRASSSRLAWLVRQPAAEPRTRRNSRSRRSTGTWSTRSGSCCFPVLYVMGRG